MKYTIIIEKGRESGYVAYAPALKGCVSQGKTKAETLKNIKEAMEAYVEAMLEDEILIEDILDINLIQQRQGEPSRPFREYLAS
ncbi:MAG TPA: type II toxin-antitoxin system HicB family antitoxin [Dehalococcoidales bacterium]|nr:type II toxin-antitoxin system HicB family antitoxin [Dehalococcoidales bacterium]